MAELQAELTSVDLGPLNEWPWEKLLSVTKRTSVQLKRFGLFKKNICNMPNHSESVSYISKLNIIWKMSKDRVFIR